MMNNQNERLILLLCSCCAIATRFRVNGSYASEEINENSKSLYSAYSSVVGGTENSRRQHARIYDNPSAQGPPLGGAYSGSGLIGVMTGGGAATDLQNSFVGTIPALQRQQLPGRDTFGADIHEHIGGISINDDLTNGAGKLDVRSGYAARPLTGVYGVTSLPAAGIGKSPSDSTGGYGGTMQQGSNYGTAHLPAIGYAPTHPSPYPNIYGKSLPAGHDIQPHYALLSASYPYSPPSASAQAVPGYALSAASSAIYPQPQHSPYASYGPTGHYEPHRYHPHYQQQGYNSGSGSHSHFDHSLKLNSEYQETGHHVGPYSPRGGPYNGFDGTYNGAFNRPIII